MSGLARLRVLQGLTRNVSLLTKKQNVCRTIGTSSKKNDTELANPSSPELYPYRKNWVTWGFTTEDKRIDRHAIHLTFFLSITLCIVGGSYFFFFMPNRGMIDWAQREAYLILREREENGIEPLGPDYYDPANFSLPTDEELGDTEIII